MENGLENGPPNFRTGITELAPVAMGIDAPFRSRLEQVE